MKRLGMVIRLIIQGKREWRRKKSKKRRNETKGYYRGGESYNGVGNKRRIKQKPDGMHGG